MAVALRCKPNSPGGIFVGQKPLLVFHLVFYGPHLVIDIDAIDFRITVVLNCGQIFQMVFVIIIICFIFIILMAIISKFTKIAQ